MPAKLSHRLRGVIVSKSDIAPWPKYLYVCLESECRWWVQSYDWPIAIEAANQHNARMNRSQEVTL